MSTKFYHDVEALVPLLICVPTRRCCVPFWNGRATSEGGERNWTKRGKIIDAGRLVSYVSNSRVTELNLNKKFYAMYRNDHRLKSWNPNCDIPIRFGMPTCRVNDDRQISEEPRHKIFTFYTTLTLNYLTDFHQTFTRCRGISVAINAHVREAMLHSVLQRESKESGQFWCLQTFFKLIGYHMATWLPRNLCHFYNSHTHVSKAKSFVNIISVQ